MTFTRSGLVALICANLVPVLGVVFSHWNLSTLLMLYWTENVLIGGFALLKMIFVKKVGPVGKTKLYKTLLFCAVYGTFVVIHGSVLSELAIRFGYRVRIFDIIFALCIFAFLLSHAVSMTTNFLRRRENEKISAFELMFIPFARVVPMHIVLVSAAFLVLWLSGPHVAGSADGVFPDGIVTGPRWIPALFVLLKIFLDIGSHLAEHTAIARR